MTTNYTLRLKNSMGQMLAELGAASEVNVALVVNQVSAAEVLLPYGIYNTSLFQPEYILEIWRNVDYGLPKLMGNTAFLLRRIANLAHTSGEVVTALTCLDLKDVVARRIVAYADQTSQAGKVLPADDMIKQFASENMGSGAVDSSRNLGSHLVIAPNLSAAPTISANDPRRRLIDVFKEITDASFTAGQYLAWDIGYDPSLSAPTLNLSTYTTVRGVDHRWPSSTLPLYLTPWQGNVVEVERSYDYRELKNEIYVGGSGVGPFQPIVPSADATSIGLGPFNRCEEFLSASNTSDLSVLALMGNQELRKMRARRTYTAQLVDTPLLKLGVQYDWGDFLTTAFLAELLDARFDGLTINLKNGVEQAVAILRSDN